MGKFPGQEAPGVGMFYKGETRDTFHTYSAYTRGTETTIDTSNYLPDAKTRESMLKTGMEYGMEASYVRLETIIEVN